MPEIETGRRVVSPQDCDILGHMNVARYIDFVSDGGFTIMEAIGLGRDNILGGKRLAFAVVEINSKFLAELLPGDCVYLRSGVVEIGNRSAVFRHRIFRSRDDELVLDARFTKVLMDLEARRATPINDALRTAMQQHMIEG